MEEFDLDGVMLRFRTAIENALRTATLDHPGNAEVFLSGLRAVQSLYTRYAYDNEPDCSIYVLDGDVCFDLRMTPWYGDPELRIRWIDERWAGFELDDDRVYRSRDGNVVDVMMEYAVPARVINAWNKAAN